MKKLKFFICFAAVLFLTTQFAAAQTLGSDPVSELKKNSLRFNNDVDLYFGVNDWVDAGITKWYSFLQMDSIEVNNAPAWNTTPIWEGGLALQLSKAYIALYYNGRYNSGKQSEGTETIDMGTGTATKGFDLDNFDLLNPENNVNQVITHNNYYGILVGFGNNSIKFTLKDQLKTIDVPVFTTAAFPDPFGGGEPDAAEGAIGKYIYREGSIMPKIQWGAAQDMTFGKYTARPAVSVALDIGFNERLLDLTDPDGTIHNFGNYKNNSLKPIFEVDTNGINFIPKGDWGNLTFGVIENFYFKVKGEGDEKAVPWGNKLTPYAKFGYQPVDYFRINARLDVPVYLGWDPVNEYYFGIGANSTTLNGANNVNNGDLPTLKAAFQLNLGFIDEITGKRTLLERFKLNWGIRVNLPGYAAVGKVTETYNTGTDDELIKVEQTKDNVWVASNTLQSFTAGITFNITDKILIDAGFDFSKYNWKEWGLTENVTLGRVLISVKH
jgi:hypothetical protein